MKIRTLLGYLSLLVCAIFYWQYRETRVGLDWQSIRMIDVRLEPTTGSKTLTVTYRNQRNELRTFDQSCDYANEFCRDLLIRYRSLIGSSVCAELVVGDYFFNVERRCPDARIAASYLWATFIFAGMGLLLLGLTEILSILFSSQWWRFMRSW